MKPGFLLSTVSCCVLAFGVQTAGAAPEYLDDRSSPETLIRSLYNAINRQEYARAYAYFDTPPASSLEAYAEGFADTGSVEVVTGLASAEGAAGSIFYSIPVAIRARDKDGGERIFAGCYDLRLVQPSVQTTPYKPLVIEKGALSPAEGSLEEALPATCGEGAADIGDLLLERAKRFFDLAYRDTCQADDIGAAEEPQSHTIRFNYAHEPEGAPQNEARLFRFLCDRAAYNEAHVYLLGNERGEVAPMRFATPELDIRYVNDDPEGSVEDISVIGYTVQDQLVNSAFDPESLSITSQVKWRGVGDASSAGEWLFRSGTFTLVRYEVDASYDGGVNPRVLLDYSTGP